MAAQTPLPSLSEIEEAVARELGWSALRQVPDGFAEAVVQAEAAALAYHRQGDPRLLAERAALWDAICSRPGFEATPLPFRLDALNRTGIAYLESHAGTADEAHFEAGVARWERALALAPDDWPEQARYLHNLGSLFYSRYLKSGILADLERALDALQQALEQPRSETRFHGLFHNTLGLALQGRYNREGALSDLESAIFHGEQALELTPTDNPQRAVFLNHLGMWYRMRFIRTRSEADIQRAVALLEQALTFTGRRDSRPYRLTNLGNALLDRFSLPGQPEDLTRALEVHQQAVDLTAAEDPNLPIRLNNLGNSLSRLYREQQDPDLLDRTVDTYRRALEHTAPGDPLRASRLYNLGRALMTRYSQSGRRDDRRAATRAFRQACSFGLDYHLEWALSAASVWGEWAVGRRAWKEAEEAYDFGMEAIDRLYQTQLLAESQAAWLREARDLAGQAAYVLARNGKERQAVEVLERGRARALHEALARQEARLEALPAADRTALEAALARVQGLQAELRAARPGSGADFPAVAADLRRAHEALDESLDRIRAEHPDFMPQGLEYPAMAELVQAVGHPLVYVLTSRSGSLALVVAPGGDGQTARVRTVRMDGFTDRQLEAVLQGGYLHGVIGSTREAFQASLDRVWQQLARDLMGPLGSALRGMGIRRALLVPTGALTLFPLHAMVHEKIVLSYLPSARALQTVFFDRDHVDRPARLLAVGDPSSQLKPALRFASLEVERIAGLFAERDHPAMALAPDQATGEALARSLPGITHLHLACHGRFELERPLHSALYLAGKDTLTLEALLAGALEVSATRLVTLSACQTGLVDFVNTPDEVVGFPAGLIQAGVPGVIGTLWPVDDASTAILMDRFYTLHLGEDLEPGAALHAAQRWLRGATAQEMGLAAVYEELYEASDRRDREAFRWMRYYRANPRAQPYDHPYYWAAFYFSGV